jgi:hypothetical protein
MLILLAEIKHDDGNAGIEAVWIHNYFIYKTNSASYSHGTCSCSKNLDLNSGNISFSN